MASEAAELGPEHGERSSLTDRAYRQLEEMIVTLAIPPGEILSEAELSKRIGIGRTPIREALYRLSREGLVRVLARRGYLVSDVNPQKQLLLLEVRRALERILARSSAVRATADERAEFLDIAAGMSAAAEADDELSFMRLDNRLNWLLCDTARNEYASRAMGLFHGLSRRFWFMHFKEVGDLPLCANLHAAQARAIGNADAQAAVEATDALMDYVESYTRDTFAPAAGRSH